MSPSMMTVRPVNEILHFETYARIMGSLPILSWFAGTNLLVNAVLPTGHHRRKPTTAETTHYRLAPPPPERRQATTVLPCRILACRNFFAEVEADLPDLAQLLTLIVGGDADIAFRRQERERPDTTFPDHTTVIVTGAGT